MRMLERIKKRQIDGFKEFVINMETTSAQSRTQIFTLGVLEDPIFMTYVMSNIHSFKDFFDLDSDDINKVLGGHDKILSLFAKCIYGANEEKILELQRIIPRLMSRLREELSYLTGVTPQEKEAASFFIMKFVRKLQMEEKILGFHWKLPSQDIFYPRPLKDGPIKILFESGVLAAEGECKKGRRIGTWKHFYDTGKIFAQGDYLDGLRTGLWIFHYSNGKHKGQGKFRADLKHGMWREWDRDGNLSEVDYIEGVKKAA